MSEETMRELLLQAEKHVMTQEERDAQLISWAYGNANIEDNNVTREMVEAEFLKLRAAGEI